MRISLGWWRKDKIVTGQPVPPSGVDRVNATEGKQRSHVIVAVPSAPLKAEKLDVPGEYERLRHALLSVTPSLTLARTRPATLLCLSSLAARFRPVIVHFIGHGGFSQEDGTPFLQFEKEDGDVCYVDAETMARSLKGNTNLVVLNACSTAQVRDIRKKSFAQTLVDHGVPLVIAMQDEIADEAAVLFSRVLYGLLAAGEGVQNALEKSRAALVAGGFNTAAELPVLLGSTLNEQVAVSTDSPALIDPLPPLKLRALPKTEGPFVGRQEQLLDLGRSFAATGRRAQLITIVGSGGEGKTALARAACDRFAFHFPDGLFAVTVTAASNRESVVSQLATLIGVEAKPSDMTIEDAVLARLEQGTTLVVIDGVEAVVDILDHPDTTNAARATDLMRFLTSELRERVSTLLLTSRRPTGRPSEQVIHLQGLGTAEGAALFLQCAPGRAKNANLLVNIVDSEVRDWDPQAELTSARLREYVGVMSDQLPDALTAVYTTAIEVSRRVNGHPLSLRLLGSAFDAANSASENFLSGLDHAMQTATDQVKSFGDRHRSLHACIEASAKTISPRHIGLLYSLRNLTGYIIPEVVVAAWDGPESRSNLYYLGVLMDLSTFENLEDNCVSLNPYRHEFCEDSPVYQLLHDLWTRGLLSRHELQERVNENIFAAIVYKMVPAVSSYLQADGSLSWSKDDHDKEIALAEAYGPLADALISGSMNPVKTLIVSECIEDMTRLADFCGNQSRSRFFSSVSVMLSHLGQHARSSEFAKKASGAATDAETNPKQHRWPYEPGHAQLEASLANALASINGGNIEQGIQRLDVLIKESQEKQESYIGALAELAMGHALLKIGDLDGALSRFQDTESYGRRQKDWELCAEALDGLVLVYLARGQTQKALKTAEQALDAIRRPASERLLQDSGPSLHKQANILHNLAEAQRRLGQLQEAKENYVKALELRRQSNSRNDLPVTLYNLAQIFREYRERGESRLRDDKQERDYLAQALEASVAVENWAAQAAILIAIADISDSSQDRYEKLLSDAVKAAERSGDVSLQAWSSGILAMALKEQRGRNRDALRYAKHALQLLYDAGLDRDASGAPIENYKQLVKQLEAFSR